MAVYCCVVPLGIDASSGSTVIVTSSAGTTVTNEEPEMSPDVAVIVVAPRATPVQVPARIVATLTIVPIPRTPATVPSPPVTPGRR